MPDSDPAGRISSAIVSAVAREGRPMIKAWVVSGLVFVGAATWATVTHTAVVVGDHGAAPLIAVIVLGISFAYLTGRGAGVARWVDRVRKRLDAQEQVVTE